MRGSVRIGATLAAVCGALSFLAIPAGAVDGNDYNYDNDFNGGINLIDANSTLAPAASLPASRFSGWSITF